MDLFTSRSDYTGKTDEQTQTDKSFTHSKVRRDCWKTKCKANKRFQGIVSLNYSRNLIHNNRFSSKLIFLTFFHFI